MRISTIIRIVGSCALLYLVFRETGPWTTIAIGLSMVGDEITAITIRLLRGKIDG